MEKRVLRVGLGLVVFLLVFYFLGKSRMDEDPIEVGDGPPNVVLVLIDTARADYLDFYGAPRNITPFLSGIAEQSTLFTRAFSTSSWTAPSTASIFTSLYPIQHGVLEGFFLHIRKNQLRTDENLPTLELNQMPLDRPTLPEIFQSLGYSTFGLSSNPNIGETMGFSRGFEYFHKENDESSGGIYKRLTKWRDAIEDSQPYFLYLHVSDPHEPYTKWDKYYEAPDGEADEEKAKYLSEIGYVDEYLRKVYELLSVDRNTLFVVVTDHGEEFLDHGNTGHKPQVYNELMQVVMMYYAPSLGIEPQRLDVNASLIDVLPTLIELVGGDPPDGSAGTSLVPFLKVQPGRETLEESLHERTLFAHRSAFQGGGFWAATYQNWKLIQRPDQSLELYDHRDDMAEQNDVLDDHPEVSATLLAALEAHQAIQPETAPTSVEVELSERLVEQLESLGYVQ